jgi:hypothetical protein
MFRGVEAQNGRPLASQPTKEPALRGWFFCAFYLSYSAAGYTRSLPPVGPDGGDGAPPASLI